MTYLPGLQAAQCNSASPAQARSHPRLSPGYEPPRPSINATPSCLAVRPQAAHEALPEWRFRRDHHVITLIATVSREGIATLVGPAERVTTALPIPMIAHRQGATLICPSDRAAAGLFGSLGKVIEVADSAERDRKASPDRSAV